jgi:Leucine-rich repeat (LRR) protein
MNKTYSKSKLEVQKVPTQSLSKALQHNLEDSLTKLSLVQKAIAIIDDVPIRYHCIETLYLSGNFISDLGNIKQFTRLKVLSLANNSLNSIHSLRCLFELTKL